MLYLTSSKQNTDKGGEFLHFRLGNKTGDEGEEKILNTVTMSPTSTQSLSHISITDHNSAV